MNGMAAVAWLGLAVLLFVIESATYQLVCIWFSVGAVLAMLAGLLGAPFGVQLTVFLIASVLTLILGRPIVKDKISFQKSPTNADSVIGQTGVVVECIDNVRQTGRVTVRGLDWTARCVEPPVVISEGSRVKILRIDGVKLIVEPIKVEAIAK